MKALHHAPRGICKCLRLAIATMLLGTAASAFALNTATITAATASPDCLDYKVVGMCYWMMCTPYSCSVQTSVKVRHYIPDAVVSSYANTGQNPWTEVAAMSTPIPGAEGGGDGTTNQSHENNLARFKNADVIGHPGAFVLSTIAGSGYTCTGAGTPFMPYLLSTLDTLAWRYNIPELVYPESLTPGVREIGGRTTTNLWGNIYPRGGFLHQVDDHKTAAVVAQRAGDIVTRYAQPHVYQPLIATARPGYWPAGPLFEANEETGKWQPLTPTLSQSCQVFPNADHHEQAQDGGYAWALWRPYSCCQQRGQTFLGSVDFN